MCGYPNAFAGRSARRAFSLAEIMIAIGILGVGMLMVAATFPVGLDQSRIVSEQTRAPIIADEAFARLQLLLAEPDSLKRIGDGLPPTQGFYYSFRQSLLLPYGFPAASPKPGAGTLWDRLPNDANLANPDPNRWIVLNEWLSYPYSIGTSSAVTAEFRGAGGRCVSVGGQAYAGEGARFYPSVPARLETGGSTLRWQIPSKVTVNASGPTRTEYIDPPYTWSALYRTVPRLVGSVVVPDRVQFVVFVNRGSTAVPAGVRFTVDLGGTFDPDTLVDVLIPGAADISGFSAGMTLAREDGLLLRIKDVKRGAPGVEHRITFASNPLAPDGVGGTPLSPDTAFWAVPADPNTGRSPCIGVFTRTFPL